MNEPGLIERCLKKEKKAWDLFVQKYSRLVYWAIRKRLAISCFAFNEEDVKSIFQEIFVSLIEGNKLSQIKDATLISGWLAMVASNKTVDFMREKISSSRRFVSNSPPLENDDSKQELFHRDLIDIVKGIIDTLSAKEKIIISLNILEGRTHKEIASILAISINTVSTVIARTKEKLRKELRKRGIPEHFE